MMHEGRAEHDWSLTSSVLSLIANCNRDSEKHPRPFTPADFNPFVHDRDAEPEGQPISELKDEWLAMSRQQEKR